MKKPALLIALGRGPKGGEDGEEAPDSERAEYLEEKKALAGDVLDAVKAGDKTGLADALEAFVMACMEE
jgi:hypothetical protein